MNPTALPEEPDPRRHAPATARNRDPILAVLREVLPAMGTVLEIASGTGEHAVFLAPRLAPRHWQPSDIDPGALASIAAWRAMEPAATLSAPCRLDVTASRWPVETDPPRPSITAVVAINLLHIAPWDAALGLLAGAGRILPEGGILYLYGPFRQRGRALEPGNAAFDAQLRERNPEWGLRELETVAAAARAAGLEMVEIRPMPADNRSVVFRRRAATDPLPG